MINIMDDEDIMNMHGRLSPALGELNVDNNLKAKDNDLPAKEKVFRRRSSFFSERRKSFAEAVVVDGNEHPHKDENQLPAEYITILNQECELWTHELNRMKDEYNVMYKKYKEFCQKRTVITEEECMAHLDEKDREYFNSLPDFQALMQFSSKAIKSTKILELQRRRNKAFMIKLVEKCPNAVAIVKKKIINNFSKSEI